MILVLIAFAIKYLLNGVNWIEAWIQTYAPDSEIPNLAKQALVAVLAYLAAHIPMLQPYLAIVGNDPQVQAFAVLVATFIVHHAMEGLVGFAAWLQSLIPSQSKASAKT